MSEVDNVPIWAIQQKQLFVLKTTHVSDLKVLLDSVMFFNHRVGTSGTGMVYDQNVV